MAVTVFKRVEILMGALLRTASIGPHAGTKLGRRRYGTNAIRTLFRSNKKGALNGRLVKFQTGFNRPVSTNANYRSQAS